MIKTMKILAIETSCDDTAVAIVENGRKVLVSLVASQEKIHASFGGVVPEVASREHLKAIYPLIEMALKRAKLTSGKIDAIAVTTGPGLLGSLMVGVNAAKTLAWLWGKPVINVDHIVGHVYAAALNTPKLALPAVALVASGGHTDLFYVGNADGKIRHLGGTRDDAAGEAFDKAARILNLGYPGGPAVAKAAARGHAGAVALPTPLSGQADLEFSFSGLKTAVSRVSGKPSDIALTFQAVVTDVLTDRLVAAANKMKVTQLILGGGVAANRVLRDKVANVAAKRGWRVTIPDSQFCTDNAAMIGAAAYYTRARLQRQWYNTNVVVD